MESKIEFLKPKLQSWHKTKSVSGFNMTYKNALSDVYKEWFNLTLNKSCSSCVSRALTKVANKVFSSTPAKPAKPAKEITQQPEQSFDEILTIFDMKFNQLKEYAKELGLPMRRSADALRDDILNHTKK
jgi:hypothetical protein